MTGGNSQHSFGGWPGDLKGKLAWKWEPPEGKYSNTGVLAPVVDGNGDLYVVIEDSIRKFSPDGRILWTFNLPPPWLPQIRMGGPWMRRMPSLIDGLLVTSMTSGFVLALDMETGDVAWNASVSKSGFIGPDYGFIIAGEGVVLGDADQAEPSQAKNNKVFALNATDGSHLWDFHPEVGVWNFLPHLLGDGTVVFQTWDGGAYRLRLRDGSVLWHALGGGKDVWTDGGPAVGPNGVFYVVRSTAGQQDASFGRPGFLDAFNISDGKLLWSNALEQTPYTYPVVGRLREGEPLSVVTGVGSLGGLALSLQLLFSSPLGGALGALVGLCWAVHAACCRKGRCCKRLCAACMRFVAAVLLGIFASGCYSAFTKPRAFRHSVQAFDAETGKLRWRYDLPTWKWYCAAGDEEGFWARVAHAHIPVCLPLSSSYPTLDAQGIFYMGHMDGRLYAIQDRNGDGRIDEDSEVCSFDTGGAFSTGGPTLVPGLMAVGTCDSLFVFRQ